jgi:hypothetical protein
MVDEEVVEEVAVEHVGGISLRGDIGRGEGERARLSERKGRKGTESEIVREGGERERDCERGRGEREWGECEIVREGGERERDSVRELCCERWSGGESEIVYESFLIIACTSLLHIMEHTHVIPHRRASLGQFF